MKSNKTPRAVTFRPNSVWNLRNLLPIGTLTVLFCLFATVILTFEVRYLSLSLGAKLVLDGPHWLRQGRVYEILYALHIKSVGIDIEFVIPDGHDVVW